MTDPPRPRRRLRRTLAGLGALVVLLVVGTYGTLSLPPFGARPEGERLQRLASSPLWRDGRLVNPVPQAGYSGAELWAMFTGTFFGKEVRVPPAPIPVLALKAADLARPPPPGLRALWIGHASVYVELDGQRLLVDPVFSEYASPFGVGPRRFHPPPIALADLPHIDAVLITHDHYDHLDMRTVQALSGRGTTFVVPLGIGAHLERWGVPPAQVRELQWWDEAALGGLRIVCTPSRHYSGRSLGGGNATLWSSWSVLGARQRFHVTGDTGWSDHFRTIGEKLGPFDLTFVKIGAYGPGQPWADIHMSAEDAVRAHVALRGKRLFPVHWATYNLAFHDWDEPIRRTSTAARGAGVELVTPRVGEVVEDGREFASTPWWVGVR